MADSTSPVAASVDAEPSGYMVASAGAGGALIVPLAFRASLEEAQAELATRWAYPSAAVYALHRVDSGRDGA